MRPAPSNRDLAIRPLALGEVIDRAVALTVRHFRPLFAWMIAIQAPAVAASRVQLSGAGEVLALLGDPAAAAEGLRRLGQGSALVVAALFLLQMAATGVCAAVVAPSLAGGIPRPPAGRRALALASAAAVNLAAFALLPALGALPGLLLVSRASSALGWGGGIALLLAGALAAFLFVVLRTLLVPVVAALEGRPHVAALRRSAALMRATRGTPFLDRPDVRASLVLLATFAIAMAVNVLVGVPRGIADRAAGATPFLGSALPLWAEIPLSIFETLASAALQPFSLVAVAVLYFDRRARREGLDVDQFADELEARP